MLCNVHATAHTGCRTQSNFPDLQVSQGRCNLYGVVVGNSSFPEGFCQVGTASSSHSHTFPHYSKNASPSCQDVHSDGAGCCHS